MGLQVSSMTDPSNSAAPLTVLPETPARKGQTALSWLVIAGVVSLILALPYLRPVPSEAGPAGNPSEWAVRLQSRWVVGFAGAGQDKQAMLSMLRMLDTGPIEQRLDYVILTGELAGPQQA